MPTYLSVIRAAESRSNTSWETKLRLLLNYQSGWWKGDISSHITSRLSCSLMGFNLKRVSEKFLSCPQSPLITGCVDVKWIAPSLRFTQIPESLLHSLFLRGDNFQHNLAWDDYFSRPNFFQLVLRQKSQMWDKSSIVKTRLDLQ